MWPVPPVHCALDHLRGTDRPELAHDVVSETLPLRVHYANNVDAAYVAAALSAVETAWQVQVAQGWPAPILPDAAHGPELDVYLMRTGEQSAYAQADAMRDADPDDGRSGTSAFIVVDTSVPVAWLDSWLAHEFNHVLQFGADYTEPSTNVWEATATAAQHHTLGTAGEWDADVGDFQATPWVSVLYGDGYWLWDAHGLYSFYEYGAAVWPMVLDDGVAGDGSALAAMWIGMTGDLTVLDGIAATGWDPVDLLREVAAVRTSPEPVGPPRTVAWPEPDHESHDGFGTVALSVQPYGHGVVHLDLTEPVALDTGGAPSVAWLRTADGWSRVDDPVTLDGSEAWVTLVAWPDDGWRGDTTEMLDLTLVVAPVEQARACGCDGVGGGPWWLFPVWLRRLRRGTPRRTGR